MRRQFDVVVSQGQGIADAIRGIAIVVAAATTISWYRSVERRGPGPRPPALKPGFAGGEA
jgi:hypothetical protein